jgi:hypothetical protein
MGDHPTLHSDTNYYKGTPDFTLDFLVGLCWSIFSEGQTTQWPKEKVQKDKQRSTKHYTYKDRVTRTPLNIGSERMCYLKL